MVLTHKPLEQMLKEIDAPTQPELVNIIIPSDGQEPTVPILPFNTCEQVSVEPVNPLTSVGELSPIYGVREYKPEDYFEIRGGQIQETVEDFYACFLLEMFGFAKTQDDSFDIDDYCSILGMVMDNAFNLGNEADTNKAVNVSVYAGKKGYLIQVKDSGDGFDLMRTIDEFRKRLKEVGEEEFAEICHEENPRYLSLLLAAESKQFQVSYEGNGNTVNMMWFLPGFEESP